MACHRSGGRAYCYSLNCIISHILNIHFYAFGYPLYIRSENMTLNLMHLTLKGKAKGTFLEERPP